MQHAFPLLAIPAGSKIADLTGRQFGRLTVICFSGYKGRRKTYWVCKCECGTYRRVLGYNMLKGLTESCGCLHREKVTKHGHSKRRSSEYRSYEHAKERCNNENHHAYKDYGGRGIEFRFASFEDFLAELGPKPTLKHSVDRKDNDGHYEVGNVRWASKKEQANNRSNTQQFTIGHVTQPLRAWADQCGLPITLLRDRLSDKWCMECAISLPHRHRCPHREKRKRKSRVLKAKMEHYL